MKKIYSLTLIFALVFAPLIGIPLLVSYPQIAHASITASSTTYSTAGTFTYKVSTNACNQDIAAIGGGGAGFDGSNAGGGEGGGGGAFASSTLALAVGTSVTLTVGTGGATTGANGASTTATVAGVKQVDANFGLGGTTQVGTIRGKGTAALSIGTTKRDGGNGGAGNNSDDSGGGGGGAGGQHAAGNDGTSANTTDGGDGGQGDGTSGGAGGVHHAAGNGDPGTSNANGGGGGGGGDQASNGGNGGAPGAGGGGGENLMGTGAAGQIIVTEFVNSAGCGTAPTVTTQSASVTGATTATANGNITATGGQNVTVRGFAYGTDSTLATVIATTTDTAGQPFSTGAFTGALSGLTGNTTYYARAYATNSIGDGLGAISAAFLTLPGTPGNPTFANVSYTTMTVNWTAPTGSAASYKLERCVTSTTNCTLVTGIAALTSAVTGLVSHTSYDFAVLGTNTSGDGVWSATTTQITATSPQLRFSSGLLRVKSGTLRIK